MPGPESKKPNLKPNAELAGWLDKLGSVPHAEPLAVKVVGPGEGQSADTAIQNDSNPSTEDLAAKSIEPEEEITGTNVSDPEPQADAAITGTDVKSDGVVDGDGGDIEPGQVLADQYEIISLLGKGGMSSVYKAKDLLMRRIVAVKCLHAHLLSDKNSILRFQKEAQAAGNLNHPHIIKIYQYGFDTKKRPFLVMDYLEGQSLAELLETNNKMEVDEALRILVEAADGLEQAHKKGVVHRDFKPSNIMLVNTEEEKNCVKIVDFGIAKIIAVPGEEGHNLTQTGEMLGSPNYMSPEQCMMFELDNRSDIYAFGCTMFATLTGSAPFRSNNLVEIYYKHMNDSPQPVAVSRPDIKQSAQLDAVILKCMAKDPIDRYQTMAEARVAIQTIIDGRRQNLIQSLKDQFTLGRLKGKARKTRKVSLIALSSLLALMATIGLGAYFSGQFSKTDGQNWQDNYIKGQERMDDGHYKDAEACLTRALAAANSSGKVLDFVMPTVEELLNLSLIECDAAKVHKYGAELAALKKQYYSGSAELDKRLDLAMKQVDGGVLSAGEKLSKEDLEQLCQSVNDQGGQLITNGFADKGLEMLLKAKHVAEASLPPSSAVQARTLHNMALAYDILGDTSKAYDLFKQSIAFQKKNLSPSDPALVKTLTGIASIDVRSGRPKLALSELQEARRIANTAYGPYSLQAASVKVAFAELYNSQGNTKLALEELRQAWAIYQKDSGANLEDKGRCLVALAAADKSMASARQALQLQEASTRKDKPFLIWTLRAVGDLVASQPAAMQLSKEAAKERAAAYYKRALALSYRLLPHDESMIAELCSRLSSYYFEKNEALGMEPWCSEKIEIDQEAYGAKAPVLVDDYLALASVYRQARRLDLCEKAINQALSIAQKCAQGNNAGEQSKDGEDSKDSLPLFKATAALAALNADRGMVDAALALSKQTLDIFDRLKPEQKSPAIATDFFMRYASLLDRAGKQDQAQALKANHKVYFGT